jgi:hypothetical protein
MTPIKCYRCTKYVTQQQFKTCDKCRKYLREYRQKWELHQYHNNPQYRIARIGRSRVTHAFKRIGTAKTQNTIDYIGCTPAFLKSHIEKLFKPGMTWENLGKVWEVDHTIPIMYGKPTEAEVISRLHYTNCAPLWVHDNRTKGNRYIGNAPKSIE